MNPILICADPGEKNAFRQLSDGLIAERPLHDPGPTAPDLVVFQTGQDLDFAKTIGDLPDQLWDAARSGRGKVVFDASAEGERHDPQTSRSLHEVLGAVGVSLEQAVYLTQDRGYAADYAKHCRRSGMPHRMSVVVHDYWIRRVLGAYQEKGGKVLRRRIAAFRKRRGLRPRRFVSMNFTPRPAKLMFLTRLMHEGLWDQGYVSFGGFDQMVRRKGRSFDKIRVDFRRLRGFQDLARTLDPHLDELRALGVIFLGERPASRPYDSILKPSEMVEYEQSWFTVVTETEMGERPSRITEKALKPLLNLHPLILFGNPGSLKLIRELGFVTFPELIDESYDDELDPRQRFEMAFAEVSRLCRMSEPELQRLSDALEDKLIFNAEWGLTKLPRKYATELDEVFLNEVMARP